MLTLWTSKEVPEKETFCSKFLQGMVNRMTVSHHKYGKCSEAYPDRVNAIKNLEERLKIYKKTGNTELLMDVANFAMIEFMFPRHKKAHFRAMNSEETNLV